MFLEDENPKFGVFSQILYVLPPDPKIDKNVSKIIQNVQKMYENVSKTQCVCISPYKTMKWVKNAHLSRRRNGHGPRDHLTRTLRGGTPKTKNFYVWGSKF